MSYQALKSNNNLAVKTCTLTISRKFIIIFIYKNLTSLTDEHL